MSESGREYFRLGTDSYSSLGRVGKKEKKIACPLLEVFACGQVSSPRLYRLSSCYKLFLISNFADCRSFILKPFKKLNKLKIQLWPKWIGEERVSTVRRSVKNA